MLKKLRFRFIFLAIVSMTVTLLVAFAAVNVTMRVQMYQKADAIIETLKENDGRFKIFRYADDAPPEELNDNSDTEKKGQFRNRDGKFMHAETPYETRYFFAKIADDGTYEKSDFSHIALVNIENIKGQIRQILNNNKTRGYIENYRFGKFEEDGITIIIGVDCSNYINNIKLMTTIMLITIFSCVVIVFVLLLIFSKRAMLPFEENREKQRRFITDAGHELKTPIAIIRSNTDVIEMIDGSNKWLTNIKQQTDRMSKLVKDLTELAKMDEENISEKEKQKIILSEIVHNTVESFAVSAESKGIHISEDIAPNISIIGDLEDIIRLTGILVDNAIKYTDDRKQIKVKLYSKSKKAIIKISNTCKGIDKNEISKFFDRFYRSDKSRNSEKGGYGIGLSMAQMIVQNHKGKISANYLDDEIVEFTVEL